MMSWTLNGSRLYEMNGRLFLLILYDDIQDDEMDAFRNVPFNQVSQCRKSETIRRGKEAEIPIIIFIGESATGELIDKREDALPGLLTEQYTICRYPAPELNAGYRHYIF